MLTMIDICSIHPCWSLPVVVVVSATVVVVVSAAESLYELDEKQNLKH